MKKALESREPLLLHEGMAAILQLEQEMFFVDGR